MDVGVDVDADMAVGVGLVDVGVNVGVGVGMVVDVGVLDKPCCHKRHEMQLCMHLHVCMRATSTPSYLNLHRC